tara:strand:+ start:91 stop:255 length:165 start_codon:yes stop_codon:yes gene_type:complete
VDKDILVVEAVVLVVLVFLELMELMEKVEMVDLVCNFPHHLEIQRLLLDQLVVV